MADHFKSSASKCRLMSTADRLSYKRFSALLVLLAFVIGSSAAPVLAGIHVVRRGETLTHIAHTYGTTIEQLLTLNDIKNPNKIGVGDELIVSDNPSVYVVAPGDTLSRIARSFGLSTEHLATLNGITNMDRLYPGNELIVAGEPREHRVSRGDTLSGIAGRYGVTTESLIATNHLDRPNVLRIGQRLIIPPTGGGVIEATAEARRYQISFNFHRWPVDGVVSSGFGLRGGRSHYGIDIAAPHGTSIRAVAEGRVVYSDWAGTYGQLVKVDHGHGVETRYAHASRLLVQAGDKVSAGQVIARVGSTGRSTGPHLHFEVRVNGEAINPMDRLPSR